MRVATALLFAFVTLTTVSARAEDRLATLSEMIVDGRAAEAQVRLRALVDEYRNEEDIRGEALALLLLGFADAGVGDISSSRASFGSAAQKFSSSGDFFTAWMALFYVAGVDTREGNRESALEQHETALAILREAEASAAPFSLDGVTAMAPMFGAATGGFGLLSANPEMMKRVFLRMAEMMSRDQIGGLLVELGQLGRAETELSRASDLSAMFFGMFDGPIAEHIGDLRRRQWRLDDARRSYLKALDGAGLMPLPSFLAQPAELKILAQLADIELLSGRVDDALAWNDRGLAFVRSSPRLAGREPALLQDRATLLMQAGRYRDALQALEHARTMAEQREDIRLQASIVTDIGSLQMYRGSYGEAAAELEKAIALYQTIDQPMEEGHAWTMLTETYVALGAYDSAGYALETARALAAKSSFPPAAKLVDVLAAHLNFVSGDGEGAELIAASGALTNMADVQSLSIDPELLKMLGALTALAADPSRPASTDASADAGAAAIPIAAEMAYLLRGRDLFRTGNVAGAREVWMKALDRNSSTDIRSGCLAAIGATYWKEGNQEEANRWFRRAADLVDEVAIADDELLARYLGSHRRVYFDVAVDMLARSGNVEEAFGYAERARARAFLRMIGNHRVEPRGGADRALVREAESLRLRIVQWERDGSAVGADLTNARNRYRTLLRRVKTSNPEYASLTRVEPSSVDDLRAELRPDATLISYFLVDGGAHVWLLDSGSFSHVWLPLPGEALRRVVCWSDRFRSPDARGAAIRRRECSDPATAEEAFDLLVAPLSGKIRNRRLFIIPHGVLHQIPFGALFDAKRGRYLIEDYTLAFVPSASALRFLRDKESPIDGGALVLGNPDGALGSLEGAEREAVAVARDLGTRAITGAEATESRLYELDGSADIVHIGAHGTYNAASPLFSRIALAPGGDHDGNLEVHEILGELDLRGVNLVVLSACRTAAGERSGGDDVVGLTRAILYAGSPGVISTLWDIDDDAAAVLMEEFYCRLLDGAPAADALRDAQVFLRHHSNYGDPRYWAAFMLVGDPLATFQRPR